MTDTAPTRWPDPVPDPDDLDVLDFDVARREEVDKPIRFRLGGELFTALPLMPAGDYLRSYGQEVPLLSYMQTCLPDDEWERFDKVVSRKVDPIDTVHVLRVVRKLEAMYSARPTRRPTGSPAGPDATGDASSSTPPVAASVIPPPSPSV
jgi:hypothetical protein